MRYLTTAMMTTVALMSVNCNDGGVGVTPAKTGGASGTASGGASASGGAGVGTGGAVATGGNVGSGGATGAESGGTSGTGTGGAGTAGTGTATGGRVGTGGGSSGGATGSGGAGTGTGGAAAGGATGLKTGPFKILVLSTTLVFKHGSIPSALKMLQDLGKATAPERTKIAGLGADTTWTVDEIASNPSGANYFSEVTAENLKNYELFYSNNPTGPVFTDAPQGAQKKMIFQEWWTNGGSWAGQHSATDFEKLNNSWNWFHDNIDGAYFVTHDGANSNGTITWQPDFINHPIVKGLPSPYTSGEEWYTMSRNVETVPGFKVLGKVTVSNSGMAANRPAVWIRENDNGKGARSFYTIKGHDNFTYAEAPFRELMLRGILWSVHRLPGGN